MSINQDYGPGVETGKHRQGVLDIEPDEDETLPRRAVADRFSTQLAEKGLAELDHLEHVHGGDEGMSGSRRRGQQDTFEFVGAGWEDGGPLADLGGIEQVEDREVLDGENFVHALEAETAFAIEKIGDMSLFESGLLCESESGEFATINALPQDFPKIVLQDPELHVRSLASGFFDQRGLMGMSGGVTKRRWAGKSRGEGWVSRGGLSTSRSLSPLVKSWGFRITPRWKSGQKFSTGWEFPSNR